MEVEIDPGLDDAEEQTLVRRLEQSSGEPVTIPPNVSAVIRCRWGFGITILHHEDGRCGIAVDPEPPCATNPSSVALREWMEEIAVGWLRQVAPHRLSDAYRSGY